jgi:predicted MPP superfamily phosphohydrolase
LAGRAGNQAQRFAAIASAAHLRHPQRILLVHNPAAIEHLHDRQFDLILAGHTHGGQVRLPLIGKALLPYDASEYDRGLFTTDAGPLYIHPGIGAFYANVRFGCRPEIALIEL